MNQEEAEMLIRVILDKLAAKISKSILVAQIIQEHDKSVENALGLVHKWLDEPNNYDSTNYPSIEQGLLSNRYGYPYISSNSTQLPQTNRFT